MANDEGIGITTDLPFDEAVMKTRISLRAHGFSILSEMPAPVGVGDGLGRRHLFLGLWQELTSVGNLGGAGLDVGDHLPVNVVVFEEGRSTVVAGMDPSTGFEGAPGEVDAALAAATRALESALQELVNL